MNKEKRIAFYGPSGSGKSTAVEHLKKEQENIIPGFEVIVLNVAEPLHAIQAYAYEQFGLENTGQDGVLLQFLAQHFQSYLACSYTKRLDKVLEDAEENGKNILILNSDVRDNAYKALKEADFVFVRIYSSDKEIYNRLGNRGDISKGDTVHKVERIHMINHDFLVENNGSIDEFKEKISQLTKQIVFGKDEEL